MTSAALIASTAETQVNVTTIGVQNDPSIAAFADGGYVLCWTDASGTGADASGTGIRLRIMDASGLPASGEILVNTSVAGAQNAASITVLANGNILVTWTDASLTADPSAQGIRAQILSPTGSKIGGELLVNTITAGGQTAPTVTALADGGFVVGWTDTSGTRPDTSGSAIYGQVFSSEGLKLGASFLFNTVTSNNQSAPSLSALASGGFVGTWVDRSTLGGDNSGSSIKAQLFDAAGLKVGGEFLVNATTTGAQDQPVVATLAGGRLVIAWRDASGIGDVSASGIRAQVFSADGVAIGSEILVNDYTLNSQAFPTVTATEDGGFAIAWQDNSLLSDDVSGYGIRAQMFDADGTKQGVDFVMNAAIVGNQTTPAIVGLAGGGIAAAWADSAKTAGDQDGGVQTRVFTPFTGAAQSLTLEGAALAAGTFEQTIFARLVPDGALNARYDFHIVDDTTGGAFEIVGDQLIVADARRLDGIAGGRASLTIKAADTFGGLFVTAFTIDVAPSAGNYRFRGEAELRVNVEASGNQQQLALSQLADGRSIAVWSDASLVGDPSGSGIKARFIDQRGQAVGTEFLINGATTGAQDLPNVTSLQSGGFVVTWVDASGVGDASSTGIKARIFDATGLPTSGDLLINQQTAGIQTQPETVVLADGSFIVTWRDESLFGGDDSVSSIKARRFDAGGQALGGEFLVNTYTASRQEAPDIVALDSGGFVIVWSDSSRIGGDTSKDAIKVQVFDSTGARVGGESLVNVATSGNQQAPAVAALDGGGFVVAWADGSFAGGDTNEFGIKFRQFDDAGVAVGEEVLANSTTAGSQIAPALTALEGGGFIVGWTDYGGTGVERGSVGVKAQVFAADGTRTGGETVLAQQVLGAQSDPVLIARADGGFLVGWTDGSGSDGDVSGAAVKVRSFGLSAATPTIAALPDQLAGTEDVPATISVTFLLQNDVGSSGSPLFIKQVTAIAGGAVLLDGMGGITFSPVADFEGIASFSYIVSDASGATSTGFVSIGLNGQPDAPRGITMNGGIVDENVSAGTYVATFAGIDPDTGDRLSYQLLDDADGRFVLDQSTGVLTVAADTFLDYETSPTLTIDVQVIDSFGATFHQVQEIALRNLPEAKSYVGTNGNNLFTAPTGDLWTIDGLGGSDVLIGNDFADVIYGGAGNDSLDGGRGTDRLVGGIGADTYYVDTGADVVFELFGEGVDLVYASASWSMSANVENLIIQGAAPVSIVGNDVTNTITGNDAGNLISGGLGGDLLIGNGGADTLFGEGGGDFLQGGDGADRLIGGVGADDLIGGSGADVFVFDALNSSVERDKIRDFAPGEDKLEMSRSAFAALLGAPSGALDATMFLANGTQATNADQHFVYQRATGILWYDPDGNGAAAQVQIGLFSTLPTLSHLDFVVA